MVPTAADQRSNDFETKSDCDRIPLYMFSANQPLAVVERAVSDVILKRSGSLRCWQSSPPVWLQ